MFACESIRHEDYFTIINKKINTTNFNFVNYEVTPLSKKSGIFGEHYILNLKINRNGESDELRFFLKTLPQAESQRNFTLEMGAFFKEEQMFKLFVPMFYENGINLMDAVSPRSYFTQPGEFLIFEDLSSKGFKCLNPRESYDLARVKLAIKCMVHMHASGLVLEEKLSAKFGKAWRLKEKFPEQFQEMLYCKKPASLNLIKSCAKGAMSQIDYILGDNQEDFKKFTYNAIEDLVLYVEDSKKFRNAICHGDLWASNIMFKLENSTPTDCLFVDFQSYRYCPPAQDLLTFIYLTTDREFRKNHLQEVLDYYYSELGNLLELSDVRIDEILPKSDYVKSCEEAKLFAVVQSVTHFQIVMMSPEGMAEFLSEPEFNKKTMFEDRSELIIKMCERDEFYKRKQVESITDLRKLYLDKLV